MARRRQMRIDPSVFLQQQGGGDEASQLAMAMEMLGFGKGQEGVRGQLALGREQLREEAGYHGRGQDIEEKKLLAETERTKAQEAFNNWVKEQQIEGQKEERKYRADQLTSERQKSIDATNAKLIEFAALEDRPGLIAEMSPDAQRYELKKQALQQNKTAKDLLSNVQAAYKTGDVDMIKKLAATNPEIAQRPEFEWTKWNQGMPGPQPGILDRLRNLVGGSEKERAATEAAKVAPPPIEGAPPPVGGVVPRPMAFTGYEPPVEGPVRRGYGAVPGGVTGTPPVDVLMKMLASRDVPSRTGYYTPQAPVEVPPAFEYISGGPSAMPPRIQPQVSVNDLLSKLMAPGTSAMAPY